jgi:hypothetical protein
MTTPTLTRNNLWAAITAKLEELFPNGAGMNRDQGWFSAGDRQARTTAKRKNADGSNTTYEITASEYCGRIEVKVEEGVDSSDWFWQPIADETDRSERVVIDDRCYTIRPDSRNPGPGDGYSGQRFNIEWLDDDGRPTGEVVTTRNLWSRGIIPPTWRARLKPNARFAS